MICECCKREGGQRIPARTCYPAEELHGLERLLRDEGGLGEVPDPNPDLFLCDDCNVEYQAEWDEQWREYYSNLMLGEPMDDKSKQSIYFPAETLEEIKREAARLDRSISWVVQRAWRTARAKIKEMPGTNETKE